YAITRGNWIDASILTDSNLVPNRPTVTYTGDAGFAVNQLSFTTSGYSSPVGSAFAAMEWRIAEISNPTTPGFDLNSEWIYEIDPVVETGPQSSFSSTFTPTGAGLSEGHTYRARVRMQDASGRWSHWSDPLEFVASSAVAVPSLAITELHYNPFNPSVSDPSDLEFIELRNIGSSPIDLTGIRLADFSSTPYVFSGGARLAAGEFIVVASNPAVFRSVYGEAINLAAGAFSGSLSNGGETVGLYTSTGVLIVSVSYDDEGGWPTAADGDGPSLEIIDPTHDANDPGNWRASYTVGGSPGASGDLPGDYDRNGTVDQLDYALWRAQFGTRVVLAGSLADG
ncbi:MAG: lamin tail domain-containing protein, partial [Planctomycetales bacterium]|nr:lamin tail domain-containing protein [Planctomycetales bacterium]